MSDEMLYGLLIVEESKVSHSIQSIGLSPTVGCRDNSCNLYRGKETLTLCLWCHSYQKLWRKTKWPPNAKIFFWK